MNIFRFLAILFNLSKKCQLKPPATLVSCIANDKDKASWQRMIKRWKGKGKELGLQMMDVWSSELKNTKMGILASLL